MYTIPAFRQSSFDERDVHTYVRLSPVYAVPGFHHRVMMYNAAVVPVFSLFRGCARISSSLFRLRNRCCFFCCPRVARSAASSLWYNIGSRHRPSTWGAEISVDIYHAPPSPGFVELNPMIKRTGGKVVALSSQSSELVEITKRDMRLPFEAFGDPTNCLVDEMNTR